ncbi:hypothetical protein [Leuconostoc pseudomesenteroides]
MAYYILFFGEIAVTMILSLLNERYNNGVINAHDESMKKATN